MDDEPYDTHGGEFKFSKDLLYEQYTKSEPYNSRLAIFIIVIIISTLFPET